MKTIGSAQQPTEAQSEMAELSQLIPWEKEAEKHVQEVEMEETEARGSQETEDHRLHREYIDTTRLSQHKDQTCTHGGDVRFTTENSRDAHIEG